MAFNFEFAFLGPKHSYIASVTSVADAGYLIDPSDTACFRVPVSFTKGYETFAQTRYISDIRGHDFLSYTGRWASEDRRGISPKSENIMNEIGALRALGQELMEKGYDKADFKLSLGPQSGSFFADVKKLKLYRWERVPRDLNNAIQGELAERGYGKISDVAMNATGGWVMHFREEATLGRLFRTRNRAFQFCWGGESALPSELVTALQQGQRRGAKIRHIFLNHQNQNEYLLLFSDGYVHANLHDDFKKQTMRLLDIWVTKTLKKPPNWNVTYSCQCLESQQREVDAAYYNRRGLFHLSRSLDSPDLACLNINLALDYLGEAITQDPKSWTIRYSQRLALVAARRIQPDPELEANITEAKFSGVQQTSLINARDSTTAGIFRNLYLQLINSEEDCQRLQIQLSQLNLSATEWSYSLASGIESFLPIEPDLGGDDYQYRNSRAVVPELIEMLGSIPSGNRDQAVIAPIRAEDQNSEQDAVAQSQRRLSELDHRQAMTSPRTDAAQRRPSELGSDRISINQRTSSGFGIEEYVAAQRRVSELSGDQGIAAQRRPSYFDMEQTIQGQNIVQRRASELSNTQSIEIQETMSELAGDGGAMAQRRSKPGGSQSFNIYRE